MIPNGKNFIIRPLASLRKTALERHPGYMEACLRLGQLDATGQHITFTKADFLAIRKTFNPKSAMPPVRGCC